jgi:hypothetical protein
VSSVPGSGTDDTQFSTSGYLERAVRLAERDLPEAPAVNHVTEVPLPNRFDD